MAVSYPDLHLLAGVWTELYSATGIPVGTPLIVQNKSSITMLCQVRQTMPVTTTDGYNIHCSSGST